MPPKNPPTSVPVTNSKAAQRRVQDGTNGGGSAPAQALRDTYQALTAKENRSVVQSVGFFGVAVAFLASNWSEFLIPAS